MRRSVRYILATGLAAGVLFAGGGCADDPGRETVRQRQDRLLKDPFSDRPLEERDDVSGGKFNELNRDALKKDLDHVLNP